MKMESQIRLINIETIIPNRFQPRLQFDEEALNELADSIREHGIIQPLVLRRVQDKFEIIAGERRYKAAQIAGLTQVPAIITNLDDNESAEVAIIENTHRRDMTPIEEAKAFKKLLDRRYVTQDQLAKRLGTSQSNVANKIRLLALDENVQTALMQNQISERHARSLLRVTDKAKQVQLLNAIIQQRWTVRQLDEQIDLILSGYDKGDISGSINTNNMDINVDSMINNAVDGNFEIPEGEYVPTYQYQGRSDMKEKKSLLFNNLENEEVNMNPNASFGFNPFETTKLQTNALTNDDTLEDLEEDSDDTPVENKKQQVVEEKLDTYDDVKAAIKRIITTAIKNDVKAETDEFDFDNMYQFVIRIPKDQ